MARKLDREREPMQVIIAKKLSNGNRPLSFLKLRFPLAVHSVQKSEHSWKSRTDESQIKNIDLLL